MYLKSPPCCDGSDPTRLALHDGTSETILAPEFFIWEPYLISAGWVAYGEPTSRNLWRYGPSGLTQATFFSAPPESPDQIPGLDAIGPDGTILGTWFNTRFRAKVGEPPLPMGSAMGRVIYRTGRFLVVMGPNVLMVTP